MTEPHIDQRIFSDREVHEILKRAVDNEPLSALSTRPGISLAELKAIGKEVGIDPARLEDAARAVAQHPEPGFRAVIGVPTIVRHQRTVEDELDTTRPAMLLSTIRRVMDAHGEVSEVGGSVEWRTQGGAVERLVSVSCSDGRTTIEGSADLRQAVTGTYVAGTPIAIFLAVAGLTASVGQPIPGVGIAGMVLSVGVLPAAYFGFRAILRKVFKSESAKLERVVQELAQLTHDSTEEERTRIAGLRPPSEDEA